jgi:hypothetical protein
MEAVGFSSQEPAEVALQSAIVGAVFGTCFGLGQWLALRRSLTNSKRWILATGLGYTLVFLTAGILLPGGEVASLSPWLQITAGFVLGGLIGLLVSFLQWWLVLRHRVAGSAIWIMASAGVWALGFAISFALGIWFGDLTFVAGPLVAIAVSGIVLGSLFRDSSES